MNATLATVIGSIVSLAGLWWLVAWGYRDYSVDAFRQRLFGLRDNLFDAALAGKVSFEDEAYGIMRVMLNGGIRFAHRWSALHFFGILVFASPVDDVEFGDRWAAALAPLSPAKAAIYEDFRRRFHSLALDQAVLGSPLFLVVVTALTLAVLPAFILLRGAGQLVSRMPKQAEQYDSLAYACGQ